MKSIIIYFTHTGNTRRVANVLASHLEKQGEVEIVELEGIGKSGGLMRRLAGGLGGKKVALEAKKFDNSLYDLICIGTPVWEFGPVPPMNTYLDECFGLEGKELVIFTTYGSKAGNERCLDYMQETLAKKGAKRFKRFSVQQSMSRRKKHVLAKIEEVLPLRI